MANRRPAAGDLHPRRDSDVARPGRDQLSTGEIAETVGISRPTAGKRVRILRDADRVDARQALSDTQPVGYPLSLQQRFNRLLDYVAVSIWVIISVTRAPASSTDSISKFSSRAIFR
jgi:DNA-binding Lrp family transcriptional regulator